jgi:hypothetical protein
LLLLLVFTPQRNSLAWSILLLVCLFWKFESILFLRLLISCTMNVYYRRLRWYSRGLRLSYRRLLRFIEVDVPCISKHNQVGFKLIWVLLVTTLFKCRIHVLSLLCKV